MTEKEIEDQEQDLELDVGKIDEDILDLKNELADIYINKAKEINSAGSFLIGDGDSIRDYLVSENLMDRVGDFFKGKIAGDFLSSMDPEMVDYFRKAKEKLDSANTKQQLEFLKNELTGTVDDNNENKNNEPAKTENNEQNVSQVETNNTNQNLGTFDKLLVGTFGAIVISQVEIDYINTEWSKIEKNIEIQGDFANIKKIEDSEGNKILESKGESPYIHKDVIKDLIGFSLLFYKKTGDELSLESAYRDIEQQKRLKKKKPKLAAEPGKSGHNLGLSIDITESDRYSKKIGGVQGLREMAAKFNFNPLDSEDWHFDYGKLPDPEDRLQLAQNLDKEFNDLKLAA